MNRRHRIAVCSRSFSRNPVLRQELTDRYEDVAFNDDGLKLDREVLVEFLAGRHKAIIGLERIDGDLLERLPDLEVVSKYGVGTDMLDLSEMRRRGVRLGWSGGVNSRAVAELVVATTIALLRDLPALSRGVLAGEWNQTMGRQLSGRTVGIIGWGSVGRDLASLLRGFGCRILATDLRDVADDCRAVGAEPSGLDDLLANSDVVTLHIPLTIETSALIDAARLSLMRPDAVLVNAARGGLVDEEALWEALSSGRLAAAACDVFAIEPPTGSPLLDLPNFLATPHIGGSTEEAYLAMGRAAIAGLDENSLPDP